MTRSEEKLIDDHIWKRRENAFTTLWSILEKDKTFYNDSLKGLIQYGNVLCKIMGKDDVVGFTRVLQHIGLKYEFTGSGIILIENAKLDYLENIINRKLTVIDYGYDKKYSKMGKDDPEEGKLGWAERKMNH